MCVCLRDSGEEILIEFMQLIYDMCFCGCVWKCEWDRACIYACVCLWECVESVFMYAWVGYECVWLVVRNSFWANTHAQRQRKLRGISGSISIKLQRCNTASVSPAQRYHLQLKEQRQMKNFSQFSYRIDFRSKKGRALLLALDSNVMKTNDMHARRNWQRLQRREESRGRGVGWVGWCGNGKGQEQGLRVGNKWSEQARKMVATQGHVSQRSEEQPRPVKWNGQRGMVAGRGEEGKRLSCVLVKGTGCFSLAFTCRFSRVCYVNACRKKWQRFRVMKTHAAWEFIEKWFESNTTKQTLKGGPF